MLQPISPGVWAANVLLAWYQGDKAQGDKTRGGRAQRGRVQGSKAQGNKALENHGHWERFVFRAWSWKCFVINAGHSERFVQGLAKGPRGCCTLPQRQKKLREQVSREAAACFSHGRKPMEKITPESSPEGATGETNQLDPGLIFETIFECPFHVATFGAFELLKTRPQANACGNNLSPLRGLALGALGDQGLELEVLRDQRLAQGALRVQGLEPERVLLHVAITTEKVASAS